MLNDSLMANVRGAKPVRQFDPEVVSESQIRFKGKAQTDRESAAYVVGM